MVDIVRELNQPIKIFKKTFFHPGCDILPEINYKMGIASTHLVDGRFSLDFSAFWDSKRQGFSEDAI